MLIQLLKWFSTYLQNLPEEYFKLPLGQQFTKAMILNGGEGARFGASESWGYRGVCYNSPHVIGYNSLTVPPRFHAERKWFREQMIDVGP